MLQVQGEDGAYTLGFFLVDVQQSAAIQARLQLEQNYAARQQAAATNLATLASAQSGVNQQQDIEAARRSAESWENATASAWNNMP